MRQKRNPQLSLFMTVNNTQIGKELEQMSRILDDTPGLLQVVFDDLVKTKRADTGRQGLTAEQVLRCAVLKQYRQLSYEELAFHLDDSSAFRRFARLDMGQYPRKSILQENIKAISEQSWEEIHRLLIDYAVKHKIEKGRKIRIDSTAIETDIHHPTDSTLLADGIRIITRWLGAGKALSPAPSYRYSDHNRVVKKRVMTILNTRKEQVCKTAYQDLLHYAERVVNYALPAIAELRAYQGLELLSAQGIAANLERAVGLLGKVIDQTRRRVINGETVPASEKVVSFFEEHSDIIVKGQRDITYGHKVFFTGGPSTLILDCLIESGNPADSDRYQMLLERQQQLFGRMPRQVSADGGFASKSNLDFAKSNQVKDAVFAKRRGLSVLAMAKSNWVYKRLRNFRAGIEAGISALKRAFGLDRCTWSGWAGFKQYVRSSVVSYNLLAMARIRLA
ncbi:ISNCY family transposase [uncultured Desulfuromonas sp.]|uniref:ISNCY family transposase n=1 Tax=uncultured Desulfuromonas sp. TaxID=181013 RepID=UPI002AAAC4E2|nr:ISNCY family transposase [uncultured Desulfuromonas sp.]